MPALSPPATTSTRSFNRSAIHSKRPTTMVIPPGFEIKARQSKYTGLSFPEVSVNGLSTETWTALDSKRIAATKSAVGTPLEIVTTCLPYLASQVPRPAKWPELPDQSRCKSVSQQLATISAL